ncbi:hypothetical protein F4703DRAFT_1787859 [Phycomyces blakesleeanus]
MTTHWPRLGNLSLLKQTGSRRPDRLFSYLLTGLIVYELVPLYYHFLGHKVFLRLYKRFCLIIVVLKSKAMCKILFSIPMVMSCASLITALLSRASRYLLTQFTTSKVRYSREREPVAFKTKLLQVYTLSNIRQYNVFGQV